MILRLLIWWCISPKFVTLRRIRSRVWEFFFPVGYRRIPFYSSVRPSFCVLSFTLCVCVDWFWDNCVSVPHESAVVTSWPQFADRFGRVPTINGSSAVFFFFFKMSFLSFSFSILRPAVTHTPPSLSPMSLNCVFHTRLYMMALFGLNTYNLIKLLMSFYVSNRNR